MPVWDAIRRRVVLNFATGDTETRQVADGLFSTTLRLDDAPPPAHWTPPSRIASFPGGWASHPGPNSAVQLRARTAHAGRLVFAGWLNASRTTHSCTLVTAHRGHNAAPARAAHTAAPPRLPMCPPTAHRRSQSLGRRPL